MAKSIHETFPKTKKTQNLVFQLSDKPKKARIWFFTFRHAQKTSKFVHGTILVTKKRRNLVMTFYRILDLSVILPDFD